MRECVMKVRVCLWAIVVLGAMTAPALVTASELYVTLSDGTLQRVLYDGANTYTLGGTAPLPNGSEVALYGTGAGLEIFASTTAAGNNTLREFSRSGSTL